MSADFVAPPAPRRPLGSASRPDGPVQVGAAVRATAARLAAAGLATARQDAERLVARALGVTRLTVLVEPARPVSPAARAGLEALVVRRIGREPLQYLLGEAEFADLTLDVGPGVFVPRPETELVLARSLATTPDAPGLAVDLCTGSGALAIGLARHRQALTVLATDLSSAALAWARRNVLRLGVADRVTLLEGDLFAPLSAHGVGGRVDLLVGNPPYLPTGTLATLPIEVGGWEPHLALDGGPDGLAVLDRILDGASGLLRPGGRLLLEIGHDQGEGLRARLSGSSWVASVEVHADLQGHDRVLEVVRSDVPARSEGGA